MLVEKLKQTATSLEYEFKYGKDHWQNLNDFPNDELKPFEERKKYILLIWQDREHIKNQFGATIGYTFYGEMLFVVRSKFDDPSYEYKYETHIKNLQTECSNIDNNFNICEEWTIKKWKEIEVENVYDTNLDGLKIQFTIEYLE